jgi:hypothetical protein
MMRHKEQYLTAPSRSFTVIAVSDAGGHIPVAATKG